MLITVLHHCCNNVVYIHCSCSMYNWANFSKMLEHKLNISSLFFVVFFLLFLLGSSAVPEQAEPQCFAQGHFSTGFLYDFSRLNFPDFLVDFSDHIWHLSTIARCYEVPFLHMTYLLPPSCLTCRNNFTQSLHLAVCSHFEALADRLHLICWNRQKQKC